MAEVLRRTDCDGTAGTHESTLALLQAHRPPRAGIAELGCGNGAFGLRARNVAAMSRRRARRRNVRPGSEADPQQFSAESPLTAVKWTLPGIEIRSVTRVPPLIFNENCFQEI
jgi:hypothetical protein